MVQIRMQTRFRKRFLQCLSVQSFNIVCCSFLKWRVSLVGSRTRVWCWASVCRVSQLLECSSSRNDRLCDFSHHDICCFVPYQVRIRLWLLEFLLQVIVGIYHSIFFWGKSFFSFLEYSIFLTYFLFRKVYFVLKPVFACYRTTPDLNTIHKNLIASLTVTELVFLIGITQVQNQPVNIFFSSVLKIKICFAHWKRCTTGNTSYFQ